MLYFSAFRKGQAGRFFCALFLLSSTMVGTAFLSPQNVLADVESGPEIGSEVASLPVDAITGEVAEQSVDYKDQRGKHPTIYAFIPQEKWSRPTARFLRELDQKLRDTAAESQVVVVWLTEDVQGAKEYLPRAQMSLRLVDTALTVFDGPAAGPDDWAIHDDADLTAVVVNDGKVFASFGFVSVNETVVDDVLAELKKSVE